VSTDELTKETSCKAWQDASSAIRTQFAIEVLILAMDKATQHPPLSQVLSLSLESGVCARRHSAELAKALDDGCKSGQSSPLGEGVSRSVEEIGMLCLSAP
jgi:hypothetical protein